MAIDQLINLLAAVTLIEMMVTVGLGTEFSDVLPVVASWGLVSRALIANYLAVPLTAAVMLLLFGAGPMIAAGFMIAAVCPGAPYGPPLTALAKGNVQAAVGLMVVLAASSALIAPLLLGLLLPLISRNIDLKIDVARVVKALLGAQLLPLCAGLLISKYKPSVADKLKKPAVALSLALNLLLLGVILAFQFRMLSEIHLRGYFAMLCLLLACTLFGWLAGRPADNGAKSMVITTSVRNVGVGLVIATACFPGTAAISSITAYALFQTVLMAAAAFTWGRMTPTINLIGNKAA